MGMGYTPVPYKSQQRTRADSRRSHPHLTRFPVVLRHGQTRAQDLVQKACEGKERPSHSRQGSQQASSRPTDGVSMPFSLTSLYMLKPNSGRKSLKLSRSPPMMKLLKCKSMSHLSISHLRLCACRTQASHKASASSSKTTKSRVVKVETPDDVVIDGDG